MIPKCDEYLLRENTRLIIVFMSIHTHTHRLFDTSKHTQQEKNQSIFKLHEILP